MSFKIGWGSCESLRRDVDILRYAIRENCKAFFAIGDTPYCDGGDNLWGYNTTRVDVNSTVADFNNFHDQMHAKPAWKQLRAAMDVYYMADDHEWGGDNWDHTLTQANSRAPINATTQAEVDEHFWRGNQAVLTAISSYYANPSNTDSEAVAERPPNAETTVPTSHYPPRYFRIGYDVGGNVNNTAPHVEFFVIDCISYRSPVADVDTSSKTLLGANQKAWLKARLLSSTATFKVVVTPKKLFKNAGADNTDTWGEWTIERNEILDYIETNSITGVLWCSGDRHTPQINVSYKSAGDSWDVVDVCACPIGVGINASGVNTTLTDQTIAVWTHTQVVGILEVTESYLEARLLDKQGGALWSGRVYAGENKLTYPQTSIAIG